MTTMTAVAHRRYGGVEVLGHAQLPMPVPRDHEVLIQVVAAALNPADAYLMSGTPAVVRLGAGLRSPRQQVRGSDCAGTVVAAGASVTDLRRGDPVVGEARGSLAQFTVADARRVVRRPDAVDPEHAAGAVMAGLAALQLLRKARLAAGQRVLVNGASGGIGHLAVQMAIAQGARVTAVCGSHNVEWVAALGPERVIDHSHESMLDAGSGFDVILDNVGDHRLRDVCALAAPRGAVLPNSGAPGPDGGALSRMFRAQGRRMASRQRIVTLYSRPNRDDLATIMAMLADGTLTVRIDTVYPLREASAAMSRVAGRHVAGKVVVTP